MASKGTKAPTEKASAKHVGVPVLGSGGSFWTAVKSTTKSGYRWVPYVSKHKPVGKGHVSTKSKTKKRRRSRASRRKRKGRGKSSRRRKSKRTSRKKYRKRK